MFHGNDTDYENELKYRIKHHEKWTNHSCRKLCIDIKELDNNDENFICKVNNMLSIHNVISQYIYTAKLKYMLKLFTGTCVRYMLSFYSN